jgi:hypothetical protein
MAELKGMGEKKVFLAAASLCLLLLSLPFFFVHFIPVADLPQHLAQIRLFEDILKNPQQGEFSINAYGANSLVYFLVGFNWIIFEPVLAGKAVILELVVAWAIALFTLAKYKERSPVIALISCIFIFNTSLYWGFINFLMGWPIFIIWYLFVVDDKKSHPRLKQCFVILVLSILLYLAHALWLLAGLLILLIGNIVRKRNAKLWVAQALCLVPIGIWSITWFFQFAAARGHLSFDTSPYWHTPPIERLHPLWIINSVLGGIRGPAEAMICIGLCCWIILSLQTNWGQIRKLLEQDFFWIGIVFTIIVLLGPEEYMNTILFAQRWAPLAVIFFLYSLPLPKISDSARLGTAFLFLSFFSIATCYSWYQFEKKENSGLEESLIHISDNSKVIGLDFVHESKYIGGYPFLQSFAYAQVLHGGMLNFSFAEHHSGIVVLDPAKKRMRQWTEGLEWYPEWVKPGDMKQFDYALIHTSEIHHEIFAEKPELKPLTTEGMWRVYQCVRDTPSH